MKWRTNQARSCDRAPRGFALPVVLMVSLALATLITVLLDRFGSQSKSVGGIVRSYESYHAGRGLHQLFEAWLRNSTSSKLGGKLGENGLALTAQLSEGLTPNANSAETVKLYLADGQGSILAEPGGLPAEEVALAQAIINAAKEMDAASGSSGSGSAGDGTEGEIARRQFGPIAVSLKSASPKTLRAAVSGATAGEKVDEIVAELLKARDDLNVASTAVSEIANKVGLAGDARANLLKVVTVEPAMWNITAEVSADRLIGGGLLMRYKGTALVGASNNSATTARSVIRQWTREDLR